MFGAANLRGVPWLEQPNEQVEIDWSNPLTRGLRAYGIPYATGVGLIKGNTRPVIFNTIKGHRFSANGTGANTNGAMDASSASLVAFIHMPADPATFIGIGPQYYVSNADRFHFGLMWDDSGNKLVPVGTRNSGSLSTGGAGYVPSFPYTEHIMVTVSSWGALNVYRNASSSAAASDTTVGAGFGNDSRKSMPAHGAMSVAYQFLFDRVLTNAEDRAIRDNPYRMFKPRTRRIWVPVSTTSGTSYTINPSGGIAFSGTSIDVKSKVMAPTGGVTFAGTGTMAFAGGGTEYLISPSGGITFAGTGTQVQSKTILPTGGITFSGSGLDLRTKIVSPIGGVAFGGTGSMTSNTSVGATQTGERTKVGVGT